MGIAQGLPTCVSGATLSLPLQDQAWHQLPPSLTLWCSQPPGPRVYCLLPDPVLTQSGKVHLAGSNRTGMRWLLWALPGSMETWGPAGTPRLRECVPGA